MTVEQNIADLVYSPEDVIIFKDGIPGFYENREFVIVRDEQYAPFEWLVSIDESQLRFAMVNPMIVYPDYNPHITRSQIEGLDLTNPEDVLMYTFVTVAENYEESTINLMGPVLINTARKEGRQIILENSKYSTKEPIIRK